MITKEQVLGALSSVMDPDLGKDIVTLGFIKDLSITGGNVSFTLELTTPACPLKEKLESDSRAAVKGIPGVEEVAIRLTSNVPQHRAPSLTGERLLPQVKNFIAVASGKGGVGKSTVSANLALALAEAGASVGLLDADIYGPSIPIMMGVREKPQIVDKKMVPHTKYGIKFMSLGFLMADDSPVIWRGPLVMQAVEQLLRDVVWGELDYLVIDLPPGTGDAQLTLTQKVPLSGAVIVTTPQDVALIDAKKGLAMFQKVNVPVLGIIENMSYFQCPHCNERTEIFSHGGARAYSEQMGVPFLGEIPLEPAIRLGGDNGKPIFAAEPTSPQAAIFRSIAGAVAARISIAERQKSEASESVEA
ncbi:MAG: Mrp/NBP35 family ATP-binding protein [Nitrospirota bacterium]|nr:Mrp/NBP35 family ATP-binding protein [Nitrospirota bacterium]